MCSVYAGLHRQCCLHAGGERQLCDGKAARRCRRCRLSGDCVSVLAPFCCASPWKSSQSNLIVACALCAPSSNLQDCSCAEGLLRLLRMGLVAAAHLCGNARAMSLPGSDSALLLRAGDRQRAVPAAGRHRSAAGAGPHRAAHQPRLQRLRSAVLSRRHETECALSGLRFPTFYTTGELDKEHMGATKSLSNEAYRS